MERTLMDAAPVDARGMFRNWHLLFFRGLAALAFGVITFVAPALSLVALVLTFGAFCLVDGVLAVGMVVRRNAGANPRTARPWMLVLEGIAGVAAATVTFIWPGITALGLAWLIACWAVITGSLEIATAVRLRRAIPAAWLLVAAGVASVAVGVLLLYLPLAGVGTLVLWTGAYAFVSGGLLIGLSLRLRSRNRQATTGDVEAKGRATAEQAGGLVTERTRVGPLTTAEISGRRADTLEGLSPR